MVLRREKGHKYMLKAYLRMIHKDTLQILIKKNLLPEEIVDGAVLDYLKNSSKIIVTVDHRALDKIRKEARATQEALIVEVPEDEQPVPPTLFMSQSKGVISDSPEIEAMSHESVWDDFRDALEDMELNALGIVLEGNDLRAHADEHGVMLEVLADLINEKAMDFIGDNLLDGDFLLYDEYKNQVKELLQ